MMKMNDDVSDVSDLRSGAQEVIGGMFDAVNEEENRLAAEAASAWDDIKDMPDTKDTATESAIEIATQDLGSNVVGEPSAPTAGLSGKFSAWMGRKIAQEVTHYDSRIVSKNTDFDFKMKNSASVLAGDQPPANIPPATAENLPQSTLDLISSNRYEELADRLAKAEGTYDRDAPHQSNFNTYSSEEIGETFGQLSDLNAAAITKQKRGNEKGVLTNKELKKLATVVRKDPNFIKEILEMEPGSVLKPENILALKQTTELLAHDIMDMSKIYPTMDDDGKAKYVDAMSMFSALLPKEKAASTEAGRTGQASAIDASLGAAGSKENVYAAVQQAQNGLNMDSIAEMISLAKTPSEAIAVAEAVRPSKISRYYRAVHELFVNGILSGLKTHLVNTVGGWMKMGMHVADLRMAAMVGVGDVTDPTDIINVNDYKAYVVGITSS